MYCEVKIISLCFFLSVRRVRPKSPKRLMSLWANLSGTAESKLLHHINHKALIFKTVCGFFDILFGCFTILLSILMVKNSPIRFTMKAIAGDQFDKTEIPHTVFFARCLGNLRAKFQGIPSNPCTV